MALAEFGLRKDGEEEEEERRNIGRKEAEKRVMLKRKR